MKPFEENVQLKDMTTLHIGGPARRLYCPESVDEMSDILKDAKSQNEKLFVLGNGSNVLFNDEGYDGWILHLGDQWDTIELLDNNRLRVQAGATNEQMADFALEQGLGGYEFASGIPGTVGGAIAMNAGAYDGETVDVIESVRYLDENGDLHELDKEDLDLSYRHSYFSDHFGVIVDAIYQLAPKDKEQIADRMKELHDRRYASQPMDKHSAGSTFKRPVGGYASKLIHDAGLQGLSVGDAMVSTKHAGFLINEGNASAKEFLELVDQVIEKVKDASGITLEMEIHRVD